MTIEEFINNRLTGITAINNAVSGNIFPSFRDDVTPSITYDLRVEEVDGTYEFTGPIHYELTVTVVAARLLDAIRIGDLVINGLDRQEWEEEDTEGGFRVIGCFYRDRDKNYFQKSAKDNRLGVVDVRFDFTVDGATAA